MLQRLRNHPATRPLFRILYEGVIRGELAVQRALDALRPARAGAAEPLLDELTAVIKTFERPAVLDRLVASIRRRYPRLRVVVVDDSRTPRALPGVETITLPFDSGVSAGRSAGLRAVRTRYVLLLDDDFILTRRTRLAEALRLMERHPEIDLMGGRVVNLPRFHAADYRGAALHPGAAPPVRPIGSRLGPLPVYDKVANFYVARTDRLRLVDWDPQIKRLDHADFFTRARGVLTVVYNEALECLHAQTPFDEGYLARRRDVAHDRQVLLRRHYPTAP